MSKLIQVLYASKSKQNLTLDSINKILEVSRKNNNQNNVTGILLYRNGEFLQLLEGDKFDVYFTLKKIREDERHTNLEIFHEAEIEDRLFDKWSMAFKTEQDFNPELDNRIEELKQNSSIKDNLTMVSFLNSFFYKKTA